MLGPLEPPHTQAAVLADGVQPLHPAHKTNKSLIQMDYFPCGDYPP